jgi:hypothetical protein
MEAKENLQEFMNQASKWSDELLTACFNKLEINKNRVWGKPDENGVVEHIKD